MILNISGAEITEASILTDRKIIFLVLLICSVFAALSYTFWDVGIAYYFKYGTGSQFREPAKIITVLGDAKWYYGLLIILLLIFYFIKKNKLFFTRVAYVLFSLITAGIINSSIKWLAGRHRPKNLFQHDLYGFSFFGTSYELTSFPSGHTSVVFCIAAAVAILFPRWSIPVFAAALVIGISRAVITVHFLGDVIGGAATGIISALIVKIIFEKRQVNLHGNFNIATKSQ